MSKQGAALQTYNNELVKHIEEMYVKRDELNACIASDERTKNGIEDEMKQLQEKLDRVKESLARRQKLKEEYDRIIKTSEGAYQKILESSQTLLSVLKKECVQLKKELDSS